LVLTPNVSIAWGLGNKCFAIKLCEIQIGRSFGTLAEKEGRGTRRVKTSAPEWHPPAREGVGNGVRASNKNVDDLRGAIFFLILCSDAFLFQDVCLCMLSSQALKILKVSRASRR
jgi:hypothetical protein